MLTKISRMYPDLAVVLLSCGQNSETKLVKTPLFKYLAVDLAVI
jgi:hypothetical protein